MVLLEIPVSPCDMKITSLKNSFIDTDVKDSFVIALCETLDVTVSHEFIINRSCFL